MTNYSAYLAKANQRVFISLNLPSKAIFPVQSLVAPAQRPTSTQRTNLFNSQSPSSIRTMASDSDYMAFLDKANKQRDAGRDEARTKASTQPSKQIQTETVDGGVKVPEQLKKVDAFYVSETDEPFEPVALSWKGASSGKWPGTDEFASLITSGSKPDIEILSEKSFDPRSQYSSEIQAVRAAVAASDSKVNESDVKVKVYRVEVGNSRVEYWIIALDGAEGKIVGLMAKAIES